jgi:hypothetical protein
VRTSGILKLIGSMADSEDALYGSTFVCPIFNSDRIATRVRGLYHFFRVPKVSPGWYRVKALNSKEAEIVGECDLHEKESYSMLFPRVRMHPVIKEGLLFKAIPMINNSPILDLNALHTVYFADDFVREFDRILCRTDGSHVWYEESDFGMDPEIPEYLRKSLEERVPPEALAYKGLNIDCKRSYALRVTIDEAIRVGIAERARKDEELELKRRREEALIAMENTRKELVRKAQDRLKAIEGTLEGDVAHAGGEYIGHEEKSDHYRIRYIVEGVEYISYVAKTPGHQVLSAGICLDGEDQQFDLKSLITVIREGQDRGLIHRTLR